MAFGVAVDDRLDIDRHYDGNAGRAAIFFAVAIRKAAVWQLAHRAHCSCIVRGGDRCFLQAKHRRYLARVDAVYADGLPYPHIDCELLCAVLRAYETPPGKIGKRRQAREIRIRACF